MMLIRVILLFLLLTLVSADITCRNEQTGEPVDWFSLYKLPRTTTVEEFSSIDNPFIEYGTAYTFMTNESIKWQMSSISFNDSQSFAGTTIQPLYSQNKDIGFILYNDQADKVSIIKGHTKGIILFDATSAIWIVHSIPHYPPKSNQQYSIQSSQCVYGQSMLCMSLSIEKLDQIGLQLLYNYPQVYESFIPDHLNHMSVLSNLARVINGDFVTMAPWFNLNYIETRNGEHLLSFAKFTKYGDDLYSGLVAPNLNSNLLTETWNNGAGTLDSNCSDSLQFQVHNIEQVKFDQFGLRFSVHRDHSKWAVTSGVTSKIVCIGDINRQSEQFKRAGGTVCFMNNDKVWSEYNLLVDQIQPCKNSLKVNKKKFKKRPMRKFKDSVTNEFIVLL